MFVHSLSPYTSLSPSLSSGGGCCRRGCCYTGHVGKPNHTYACTLKSSHFAYHCLQAEAAAEEAAAMQAMWEQLDRGLPPDSPPYKLVCHGPESAEAQVMTQSLYVVLLD